VIRDYLAEPVEMNGVGIIINPPFRLAEAFIRKAISDGCHYHAWLLRTNFLESVSRLALWHEIAKPDLDKLAPPYNDAPARMERAKSFVECLLYVGRL
jgi:hypothetical protein